MVFFKSLMSYIALVKYKSNGKIPNYPNFQKGRKNEIENYQPIANLCSTSKIFEKLILKQINHLESKNKLDLNCKQQHGFKRNKSTAKAGALLLSLPCIPNFCNLAVWSFTG